MKYIKPGVYLTPFVESVLNEIQAWCDDAVHGLKSRGEITITVDFAEHRCGNCEAPFAEDPVVGVAFLTNVRTGERLKLCPPCYVALDADAT